MGTMFFLTVLAQDFQIFSLTKAEISISQSSYCSQCNDNDIFSFSECYHCFFGM